MIIRYFILALVCLTLAEDEFSPGETATSPNEMKAALPVRYLLFEVNYGEGFNLRRDVYIRMANMVKFLNDEGGQQWVLVLPPWGNIYHWQSPIKQTKIPWSRFFDLDSFRRHIPVMELADWMAVVGTPAVIDEIYYLQTYSEGWVDEQWTERRDIRPCNDPSYYKKVDGEVEGHFWGYTKTIKGKSFECLSVQNEIKTFTDFLRDEAKGQSILIDRGETLTHGRYSEWSKDWWLGRRSIRFSKKLMNIGDEFRKKHLESTDEADLTLMDSDWTKQQKALGSALGGPYLAIHLRRKDFLRGSRKEVPSLSFAAEQIEKLLVEKSLSKVFIATDAPESEFQVLTQSLGEYQVYRYVPTSEQLNEIGDGGVAIVDQWIAAHARYFAGTSVSTFSFRIHEERSLLGFPPDSTYNRLCGEKEDPADCAKEQPGRWFPKYD
ncbi:GDP-fucose protein O-fucosyltransferase 2-like [Watersipora subatra]|uniref:GDP-fucose protein O-fucosyltransferase 2-like n=1 Tax=Watersipora subatra TaxID=2589382 RepID=UPI00355B73D7